MCDYRTLHFCSMLIESIFGSEKSLFWTEEQKEKTSADKALSWSSYIWMHLKRVMGSLRFSPDGVWYSSKCVHVTAYMWTRHNTGRKPVVKVAAVFDGGKTPLKALIFIFKICNRSKLSVNVFVNVCTCTLGGGRRMEKKGVLVYIIIIDRK